MVVVGSESVSADLKQILRVLLQKQCGISLYEGESNAACPDICWFQVYAVKVTQNASG